jgi:hypothetical protein
MSDPLSTYLHDHLAGAVRGIDLLRFIRDQHVGEQLGQVAAGLLVDIEAGREVLRGLAERAGAGSSGLKELTAWLGEKVSRIKLRRDAADGLGTFEALEFLETRNSREVGRCGVFWLRSPRRIRGCRVRILSTLPHAPKRSTRRRAPLGSRGHGLAMRCEGILASASVAA